MAHLGLDLSAPGEDAVEGDGELKMLRKDAFKSWFIPPGITYIQIMITLV